MRPEFPARIARMTDRQSFLSRTWPYGVLAVAACIFFFATEGNWTDIQDKSAISLIVAALMALVSAFFVVQARNEAFREAFGLCLVFAGVALYGLFDDRMFYRVNSFTYFHLYGYLWLLTGGSAVIAFVRAVLKR